MSEFLTHSHFWQRERESKEMQQKNKISFLEMMGDGGICCAVLMHFVNDVLKMVSIC